LVEEGGVSVQKAIFRVRGHTGWVVFLNLYLRGDLGGGEPFRRK
jgi:hypothetical protein